MRHGFLKIAAATPDIQVADCEYNAEQIISRMREARAEGAKILALSELCVTAYTCQDLFLQRAMLDGAKLASEKIIAATAGSDMITIFGAPMEYQGKLYNCAIVAQQGKALGVVPKTFLPNYNEFYEKRHFAAAPAETGEIKLAGGTCPFGTKLVFQCQEMNCFSFSVEICEDLWSPNPPSVAHACAGAMLIVNLSASDENIGKEEYRRSLIKNQSARLVCGYVYADAGDGESTTDMVFAGHNIIAENGAVLAESPMYQNGMALSEIDFQRLESERRRLTTFPADAREGYTFVPFSFEIVETQLTRKFPERPFIPSDKTDRERRCESILAIQSLGLKKRLAHAHAKTAVIGVSGGLDSTLALLVAARAMDKLGRPRTDIVAVTMPCFGTTKRTKSNAEQLAERLGVTLLHVDITDAVNQHFSDIGHNSDIHDVTYENSQARERTQVIMDIANKTSGIVVGTGDLSELALGWATYNGDHMIMYGVNASVPKTLIRHIVLYEADYTQDEALRNVLLDILDTPVSPELLPAKDGEISQKTEELVGPYDLHDFYLYYAVRWGFTPQKVYRLAVYTLGKDYDKEVLLKWLKNFYRRFFQQQFKRSCLPDGPKVGSVTLSPRGDWRMPSDACADLWLKQVEQIEV